MKYIYPSFSKYDLGFIRFGGPGLGNLLFIFAHAAKKADEFGYEMIWPTWPSIKLGPWIRREKDKRFYGDLFTNKQKKFVWGGTKLRLLSIAPKAHIRSVDDIFPYLPDGGVYVYSAYTMRFGDLLNCRDFIKDRLFAMLRDSNQKCLKYDFSNCINVHVRLGDFGKANEQLLKSGTDNTRIPIEWYVHIIEEIQDKVKDGEKIIFNIFSDGSDEELKPILELQNTARMFWGNAISDIVALSQSRLIIASGSSFSMWGRFIGNTSCITFTNQLKEKICTDECNFEYEIGMESALSPEIIEKIDNLYSLTKT